MNRPVTLLLPTKPGYPCFIQGVIKYLLLVTVLILIPVAWAMEQDQTQELETIQTKIKDVEAGIELDRNRYQSLQQELRQNEIILGEISLTIRQINQQQDIVVSRLNSLISEKTELEAMLTENRAQLARQIRAAYITGRDDYLKLLLNQEDPHLISRILTYYEYQNRARMLQIREIEHNLQKLESLHADIQNEKIALENLISIQQKKSDEILAYRQSRQTILTKLEQQLDLRDHELQSLKTQEKSLLELIEKLENQQESQDPITGETPFETLKGKLNWPVEGKISNRFGSQKNKAGHKWQGVKITASSGSEVRAISSGKVIFADWFKHLGLLIILDHGSGYMSLYGNNESLLKKPGDWVLDNEIISYAGDSGGQDSPGVYLEIRQDGKPLDPVLWCKN